MPMFSPDGTRIAFVREEKRAGDRIVVVNADGTGLRVFNPPGTGVVFEAMRAGQSAVPRGRSSRLVDGRDEHRVRTRLWSEPSTLDGRDLGR